MLSKTKAYSLGISCSFHDIAACLVQNSRIDPAAQEERLAWKKHDPRFPENALRYCLKEVGITFEDLDCLVYYDKTFLTFERLLMSCLTVAPKGSVLISLSHCDLLGGLRMTNRRFAKLFDGLPASQSPRLHRGRW